MKAAARLSRQRLPREIQRSNCRKEKSHETHRVAGLRGFCRSDRSRIESNGRWTDRRRNLNGSGSTGGGNRDAEMCFRGEPYRDFVNFSAPTDSEVGRVSPFPVTVSNFLRVTSTAEVLARSRMEHRIAQPPYRNPAGFYCVPFSALGYQKCIKTNSFNTERNASSRFRFSMITR